MKNQSLRLSRNRSGLAVGLAVAGLGWTVWWAASAEAAISTWQNMSGGDFTNAANWVGGVPGTGDTAQFLSNASYTVTFSSSVTNQYGVFAHSSGTTTLDLGSGNEWRLLGASDSVAFQGAGGTVNLNGGTLSMADKFGLGSIVGANNNTFQVYGGAVINLNGTFGDAYLGENGFGNTMIISNGASLLTTRDVALGYNAGGSNTTVVVTGNGSVMRLPRQLVVGRQSDHNLLRIEAGGFVSNYTAYVGGGYAFDVGSGTGNFNRVIVSAGYWTNRVNLVIGQNGAGNRVTVTNGGLVYVGDILFVGGGGVVDPGAISYSNTLEIAGGTVSIEGNGLAVGSQTYASNNTVLVNGPTSLLQVYRVAHGGNDAVIGSAGAGNALIITNGGKTLVSRDLWMGQNLTASNNLVLVTGANSLLGGIRFLGIGISGPGNELRVENSGLLTNSNQAYIGGNPGFVFAGVPVSTGDFNRVTVTSGGMWTNANHLWVGYHGRDNRLTVSTNGILHATGYLYVGGVTGLSNSLHVLDGGSVSTPNLILGTAAASSNNAILVSGSNAVLRAVNYEVTVGYGSGGNSLTVTNGGKVIAARDLVFGRETTASNNLAVVTGSKSLLAGRYLAVGANGYGNELRIENGGLVTNTANLYIGGNPAFTVADLPATTGNFNRVTVTSGGMLTNASQMFVGYNGRDNRLTVSTNGIVHTASYLWVGVNAGTSNSLHVLDGGSVSAITMIVGNTAASSNNTVLVSGSNAVVRIDPYDVSIGHGSGGNSLTVSNGGKLFIARDLGIGLELPGSNNLVLVTGSNSLLTASKLSVGGDGHGNELRIENGGVVSNFIAYVGGGYIPGYVIGLSANRTGNYNRVTVTSGGVWSNFNSTAPITIGYNGEGNSAVITNGGRMVLTGTGALVIGQNGTLSSLNISDRGEVLAYQVMVGAAATATNNSVFVGDGGLLRVHQSLTTGSGTGNTISNVGGVIEFTGLPVITPNGFGKIATTDGTISFTGPHYLPDIYGNQTGSLTNMAFAGANTFRLNATTNAASGQTYTFTSTLGGTNYARLELMNGHTAYRGGDITVGSGGSVHITNTTATISGLFTNAGGTVRVDNAHVTWQSRVVNNGAWITDPSTNVFFSDYTVLGSGSITMSAGDVFIFKSNFVNQSTQSNTYNTTVGKFLFDGGGHTQQFFTAALDLGPGGIYPTLPGATNVLPGHLPTNNFVLGTLELSNFSTVMVTDAFVTDGQRAALYVENLWLGPSSLLIISNDVSVYFIHSNNWSFANVALLGNAELHQLVPEPSVMLLLVVGGAGLAWWRRRGR